MGAISAIVTKVLALISRRDSAVRDPIASMLHWTSADGVPIAEAGITPDGKHMTIIHPYWWAARPATSRDVSEFKPLPKNHLIAGLIAKASAAILKTTAVMAPFVTRRKMADLKEWANLGRVPKCRDCGSFCPDLVSVDVDASRQIAYNNVARLHPWKTRFQRDVFAALLDTAPNDEWCWMARTHIYRPGGGAYVTLWVDGAKWFGQIQSAQNTTCRIVHHPAYDSCPECDRPDAEFWRENGDGRA